MWIKKKNSGEWKAVVTKITIVKFTVVRRIILTNKYVLILLDYQFQIFRPSWKIFEIMFQKSKMSDWDAEEFEPEAPGSKAAVPAR